ncbi:MAG TPA: hypothetical protein VLQ94_03215, partial [Candidatus Binatia bacterium]|nr:hypothetical protein [Candidatus Binatia bacterium]
SEASRSSCAHLTESVDDAIQFDHIAGCEDRVFPKIKPDRPRGLEEKSHRVEDYSPSPVGFAPAKLQKNRASN